MTLFYDFNSPPDADGNYRIVEYIEPAEPLLPNEQHALDEAVSFGSEGLVADGIVVRIVRIITVRRTSDIREDAAVE